MHPPSTDQVIASIVASHGFDPSEIHRLAGDVSARRYFRVVLSGGNSLIAAAYPADIWPTAERFTVTNAVLAEYGVRVAEVFASDPDERLMLLEDLGDPVYSAGDSYEHSHREVFKLACAVAGRIATIDPTVLPSEGDPLFLGPLDVEVLGAELEMTATEFVERHGDGTSELADSWRFATVALAEVLAALPLVVCHRDFMVRNLIAVSGGDLAVIDHQDLRLGPHGYDFASLMNDSLFPPTKVVASLRQKFLPDLTAESYAALSAQRGLKAVGSYARAARRGNSTHVGLIQPTLQRALGHLSRLPGAGECAADLSARLNFGD